MFGPFASPYLHLLNRSGMWGMGRNGSPPGATPPFAAPMPEPEPQLPQSPLGGFGSGFGGVGTQPPAAGPDPFALDDDARRRIRNQGLMGLGAGLLSASSSGDIAGGVGAGLAAFTAARQAAQDREQRQGLARAEEARRVGDDQRAWSAERRAQSAEEDRDTRATLEAEAARLNIDHTVEDRARFDAKRTSTASAASRMVEEINGVAAANPEDSTLQRLARQAAAYSLGEDSDLDALTKLHTTLTGRAGLEDDFDRETGLELRRDRAQAAAGYGPIDTAARAREGMALERERLGIYRQEAGRRAAEIPTGTGTVKPGTYYDDVEKELNKILDPIIKGRGKDAGKIDTSKMLSPEFMAEEARRKKAGLPSQGVPTVGDLSPEEIAALREKHMHTALANVDRIYGLARDPARTGAGAGGKTSVAGGSIAGRGGSGDPAAARGDANHVRNTVVQELMDGGNPEEGLMMLRTLARATGGRIHGYTPEEYLENAKRRAQQLGWKGGQ
jgi:hypothetical protein